MELRYDLDLSKYKIDPKLKRTILRNCVKPEVGKYIFEEITKG